MILKDSNLKMPQHKILKQNTIKTKITITIQNSNFSLLNNSPMCMVPIETYPGGGLWWSTIMVELNILIKLI